jgi:hypothetical protein
MYLSIHLYTGRTVIAATFGLGFVERGERQAEKRAWWPLSASWRFCRIAS